MMTGKASRKSARGYTLATGKVQAARIHEFDQFYKLFDICALLVTIGF
jgi:hypothetical protein